MSMIEVRDLWFAYARNREPAIKGISFEIAPGEIFGFLGPSGAGKSTTQKVLIGLLHGYQGSVIVSATEVRKSRPRFYERVGVVFEFPNLFHKFTAIENLNYFRSLYSGATRDPHELLALVDLTADANTRVSEFSKGMKMRLNFCRGLLNNPSVLFLDEPTSGLDLVNARKIKEIVVSVKSAGTTIFLTTHNMQVAQDLCDRVSFIVDGTLRLTASPRELMILKGRREVRLEYRQDSHIVTRDFPLAGLSENTEFLDLLRNCPIERLHTLEATLEDVFIETTGRKLL